MLPVPWTAAGQDGPKWLHANAPIQPMPKAWALHVLAVPGSQSQTLTEPTANQGSACHKMPPCQLPASQCLFPSQGAVWDGQVPTAGPSQEAALGPEPHHSSSPAGSTGDWEEARRCFSRNEVRRKVFLTKNCSLCLSVSGVNSLDIGMISPLRMIMALQ